MAIEVRYRLHYEGSEADQHRLPAHAGAQSLEGMSWSLTVLSNYLASGRLKSRGRIDDRIQLFVEPSEAGSFSQDVIVFVTKPDSIFLTSILGSYAVATVGGALNTFIVHAIKQVCGLASDPDQRERSWLDRFPSGDFEAAIDAIEPSIKRAHSVVGEGAKTLSIEQRSVPVVTLNPQTKAYVNANIEGDDIVEKTVSVGALNVNTGNGRAYLPEVGKTVPFNVSKEPSRGTYTALSNSLARYARGQDSNIVITCREYFSYDERIKKLVIYGARNEPTD